MDQVFAPMSVSLSSSVEAAAGSKHSCKRATPNDELEDSKPSIARRVCLRYAAYTLPPHYLGSILAQLPVVSAVADVG